MAHAQQRMREVMKRNGILLQVFLEALEALKNSGAISSGGEIMVLDAYFLCACTPVITFTGTASEPESSVEMDYSIAICPLSAPRCKVSGCLTEMVHAAQKYHCSCWWGHCRSWDLSKPQSRPCHLSVLLAVSFLISPMGMDTCLSHEVVLRIRQAKALSESGSSVKT